MRQDARSQPRHAANATGDRERNARLLDLVRRQPDRCERLGEATAYEIVGVVTDYANDSLSKRTERPRISQRPWQRRAIFSASSF
jgi:hypothetical protein